MSAVDQRDFDVDIVMVSDFRYPGGTSGSLHQEICAQADAGYSTALVHVPSPRLKKRHPFHPRIQECLRDGRATLRLPDEPVRARLATLRHPAVFSRPPAHGLAVHADRTILVANQPPQDRASDEVYYSVPDVARTVADLFGAEVTWAPIGPLAREALSATGASVDVLPWDWHNILDARTWAVDRRGFVADRPVIGRHSRPDWRKWPSAAEDILAAYPDDPNVEVRILGGAEVPERLLGRLPDNWTVYGFNEVPVREFLAGVDFFVYFHHPDWIEAFGRTILEALATGAVAILPRHFEPVFGSACLYAAPADVRTVVDGFYGDPAAYEQHSRAARQAVEDRFSWATHARRIEQLIGPPSAPPAAATTRRATPGTADPGAAPASGPGAGPGPAAASRNRVVFVSSNGSGVGHLMRLMAMARRCSDPVEPVFLTLSQAVSVVRQMGFLVEYCPSARALETTSRRWNPHFTARLLRVLRTYDAQAVVFDGTVPYAGLLAAAEAAPAVRFVWSRRAMWRAEASGKHLQRARSFDLVIEPGEFAAEADRGPTVAERSATLRVEPVLFTDPGEVLERRAARRTLGLDPDRPAALVSLGAGNINDLGTQLGTVVRLMADDPDLEVCVTQSVIARSTAVPEGVRAVSAYPMSRYLSAFDFAVAASGYNTFHELIAAACPAIFLPNLETEVDDQVTRAAYAERVGAALCVTEFDAATFAQRLAVMRDEQRRAAMARRCRQLFPGNGAHAAMEAVEALLAAAPTRMRS